MSFPSLKDQQTPLVCMYCSRPRGFHTTRLDRNYTVSRFTRVFIEQEGSITPPVSVQSLIII